MPIAVRPTTSEPRRIASAPAAAPALDLEPPVLDASAGGPAGSVDDSASSQSPAPLSAPSSQKRGRSVWALADQILISGTNFVTMVLVARGLDPAGFGAFNLVYGALLFANLFQSALVTQPHNVLGTRHGRRGPTYARYTTSTFVGQLVIVLVCATAALAGAGVAHVHSWQTAGLLMSLAPAIVGWQLQEFVRRVLYTEGRYSAALVNDVLSYGGQTIAIAVLWYLHKLTGVEAMYVLAITNAAGALLGVWQLHGSLSRHFDVADLWHNWHFGKWLAGGELLQWLSSIYLYQYLLAELLNAQATAQLKAAQLVFGPTRVLAFFLGTVLPIRFTHALAEGGERSMRSHYHRMLAVVAVMTGGYCLTVGVLATPLLRLFYKDKYAGSEPVIILYATAAFLTYLSMVITAALTARRQTRGIFIGNVCGTLIGVALSLPMIRHWGVNGAVVCMIASAVTMMLVSWFALRRGTVEVVTSDHAREFAQRAGISRVHMAQPPPAVSLSPIEITAAGGFATRAALLRDLLRTFDEAKTPYCWLHGHDGYPQHAPLDVDCLIPRDIAPAELIRMLSRAGARPIQWLDDDAQWIVFTDNAADPTSPPLVQLHATSDYTLDDRVFYRGEELLPHRRRTDAAFDALPPALEFACVLVNRVSKRNVRAKDRAALDALFARDGDGCRREMRRFWREDHVSVIASAVAAAGEDGWQRVDAMIDALRADLLNHLDDRRLARVARKLRRWGRRVARWCTPRPPCGLHVVFLGPDGVGKSTVIEGVTRALAPAFLRTDYFTFAPSIVPRLNKPATNGDADAEPAKTGPHALPPRSYPASLLKAGWWFLCYTVGYLLTIHPAKARSSLVINHRYFVDAIVDRRRYRYSGPVWLLKLIWRFVPRPDLFILLDAPAEVIWPRKREVAFEETARQRQAYRDLIAPLSNAHVIDAAQSPDKVVGDVNRIILGHLASRVARRIDIARTSAASSARPTSAGREVSAK